MLLNTSQAESLMSLLEAQASPPHVSIRRDQALALSLLLAECTVDDGAVELPARGLNACERCGLYTGEHYYSANHCNETGADLVLCEPCAITARDGGKL